MSVLVLCSGGMDSVITFYYHLTKHPDQPVHMLAFEYGQRHHAEIEKARHIFDMVRAQGSNPSGTFRKVNLAGAMPRVGSLMRADTPVTKYGSNAVGGPDASFIPYRNIVFLSVAAQWARELNCNQIATGLRGGFPDCTHEFEWEVEQALAISDPEYELYVMSPVHMSRAESLRLALTLPGCWEALAYTLTCFEGTEPPCGDCLPCIKRAEGFMEIGKPDPLLERLAQWKSSSDNS
jgi:7-cyano-7-deazaguanine synthase